MKKENIKLIVALQELGYDDFKSFITANMQDVYLTYVTCKLLNEKNIQEIEKKCISPERFSWYKKLKDIGFDIKFILNVETSLINVLINNVKTSYCFNLNMF